MAYIQFQGVGKSYEGRQVVSDYSLAVGKNTITGILGPSGCGKTTILRMLAGLERPDTGKIYINKKAVYDSEKKIDISPEKRDIGMVFQDYALWPHMTVEQHIDFVFRAKKIPHDERRMRMKKYLEMVSLKEKAKRFPHQLSGGEKQRVALIRAIAQEPKVLLLDEPFSNLDQILRKSLKKEIIDLHEKLGTTMIYVTHSCLDITDLADRIVILNEGKLIQEGTLSEVLEKPASEYVAQMLGK
jgi:ABC-type Fe3+/spermidine/putrescine transport system ATPase subunit